MRDATVDGVLGAIPLAAIKHMEERSGQRNYPLETKYEREELELDQPLFTPGSMDGNVKLNFLTRCARKYD